MKRTDLIPVMLLVPVLAFVGMQAMHTRAIPATTAAASLAPASRAHKHRATANHTTESAASIVDNSDDNATLDADVDAKTRDVLDIRRRIQLGENGTYIGEILGERDSALARWPERVTTPVRVWVGSGPA